MTSIILDLLLSTAIIGTVFVYFHVIRPNRWQTQYAKVVNCITIYGGLLLAFAAMDVLEYGMGFNQWFAFLVVLIPSIFVWEKIDQAMQIFIAKRGYY